MANWFTSDLHFDHRRIVEFTNRGVATNQSDHTEWLIDLWNSTVAPGDVIYHLGDFSFEHNPKKIENVLCRLNGVKHFIKGNHDSSKTMSSLRKDGYLSWYGDAKSIKIENNHVELLHYPMAIWNRQHHGSWHLHGHSHGSYNPTVGRLLDVGLDNAYNLYGEHKFFSEEDIIKFMSKRKHEQLDHHKEKYE